ncbi:hypothetical protein PH210_05765 [Paenibacillus sp. BSR1-1]|uniref:hypothetical protein n=1 Tax=Paenibacillus sp. BSR1-1 TaxID=3020845 RepID=UPI0025AF336B|nr:hypothetical protein [Paenibacillus sp. BSR1-1]MDN3015715.1 hypothetical protein [Paenibacillus sp. BSR1-1]
MMVAHQVSAFLFVLGVVRKFEIIIFLVEVTGARVEDWDGCGDPFFIALTGKCSKKEILKFW